MWKNRKGFTVVELSVVLALSTILTIVIVSSMAIVVSREKGAAAIQDCSSDCMIAENYIDSFLDKVCDANLTFTQIDEATSLDLGSGYSITFDKDQKIISFNMGSESLEATLLTISHFSLSVDVKKGKALLTFKFIFKNDISPTIISRTVYQGE